MDVVVIPRLHNQANNEQSSSKHPANAFKIHVHDVCSNCSTFARCLLDVCLMIVWSCKLERGRPITHTLFNFLMGHYEYLRDNVPIGLPDWTRGVEWSDTWDWNWDDNNNRSTCLARAYCKSWSDCDKLCIGCQSHVTTTRLVTRRAYRNSSSNFTCTSLLFIVISVVHR